MAAVKEMPRNLLVIVIDQFRADLLEGTLADTVPLPNLRRLASQSLTFRNHHTVTVPCGPSRASLLTGQYGMNHRSIHNGTPLSDSIPNMATIFREIGREILLFGYTDTQPDPTRLTHNDPARRSYTAPLRGVTEVTEMREEAWAWLAHLRAVGYDVPDAESDNFKELYRPSNGVLGGAALYDAKDSDTAFLTDQAIRHLDVRKSRPWSALVTYIRPHPPFVAPSPWNEAIDPDTLPDPVRRGYDHPFFDGYFAAPSAKDMFWDFDGDHCSLSRAQISLCRATYLGLAAEVDHHIGRLMDWLEVTGQADDTMIVLTADHGEMLGDLGLWGKQTPFRAASHIPLMMRIPGVAGQFIETPSRSVDIMPTILERFGTEVPVQIQGSVLGKDGLPDDTGVMVEVELAELFGEGRFEAAWGLPPAACRAVAFERFGHRLVYFANRHASMLFDVVKDPACSRDISDAEPEIVQDMTAELLNFRIQNAATLF